MKRWYPSVSRPGSKRARVLKSIRNLEVGKTTVIPTPLESTRQVRLLEQVVLDVARDVLPGRVFSTCDMSQTDAGGIRVWRYK